jgi:short-subunit dehydrogenase
MARREIKGSRVIVTGASSGIGRELARELGREGAELVVVARREPRLRELAGEIGGRVEVVAGDITDAQTRRRAVEAAQSSFGGLDILVNNAGVGAVGLFEHADPARIRQLMELNFFAVVEMTRAALPLLKLGTNPMVVNVGSVLGHRAVPLRSEYCASKFAVQGFSESIRAELAAHRIDVLVVSPGATDTEFAQSVVESVGEPAWLEPSPVPAVRVARKTVKAIRRGRHEIMPYAMGKLLFWANRVSPRLVDYFMARYT